MKHPSKENLQKVITNLEEVLPFATKPYHLDMLETTVQSKIHPCGSVHCFAGWYAASEILNGKSDQYDRQSLICFSDGTRRIGDILGFDSPEALYHWADSNPDIWGNTNGRHIFSAASAFYHPERRPNGAENLQHIIDHLKEVKERLPNEMTLVSERLDVLRNDLFEAIDHSIKRHGHHKSYEGRITLVYPHRFEKEYRVTLDCYVCGPSRHYSWQGDNFSEALDKAEADIRTWISDEFAEE